MSPISDDFVVLWKKGKEMVATGSILFKSDDNRVKLEETDRGNTLMISLAEPSDAGEYTCQVSSSSGDYIKHNIQIRGKIFKMFTSILQYVRLNSSGTFESVTFFCVKLLKSSRNAIEISGIFKTTTNSCTFECTSNNIRTSDIPANFSIQ